MGGGGGLKPPQPHPLRGAWFNSTANRFDLCFDLNTGFARMINTHSVLFGNVARLNLQFDVLDLYTGLALVVKTLPDGTFSSIWVNRDGIRTLFRFVNTVNTLVRFRVDFVSWTLDLLLSNNQYPSIFEL